MRKLYVGVVELCIKGEVTHTKKTWKHIILELSQQFANGLLGIGTDTRLVPVV